MISARISTLTHTHSHTHIALYEHHCIFIVHYCVHQARHDMPPTPYMKSTFERRRRRPPSASKRLKTTKGYPRKPHTLATGAHRRITRPRHARAHDVRERADARDRATDGAVVAIRDADDVIDPRHRFARSSRVVGVYDTTRARARGDAARGAC